MERRLYLARKQFERMHEAGEVQGYVCSLSTKKLVCKAMCSGTLLREFYPDLASAEYVTPFTVFHQRYATNTAPTWDRAQPGRTQPGRTPARRRSAGRRRQELLDSWSSASREWLMVDGPRHVRGYVPPGRRDRAPRNGRRRLVALRYHGWPFRRQHLFWAGGGGRHPFAFALCDQFLGDGRERVALGGFGGDSGPLPLKGWTLAFGELALGFIPLLPGIGEAHQGV